MTYNLHISSPCQLAEPVAPVSFSGYIAFFCQKPRFVVPYVRLACVFARKSQSTAPAKQYTTKSCASVPTTTSRLLSVSKDMIRRLSVAVNTKSSRFLSGVLFYGCCSSECEGSRHPGSYGHDAYMSNVRFVAAFRRSPFVVLCSASGAST